MSYKVHKNTKLTPAIRIDIWNKYKTEIKVSQLACMYNVSRPYKVIKRARLKNFSIHKYLLPIIYLLSINTIIFIILFSNPK